MPQAARLELKQVSEAKKLVSANSQVRGCPAGKFHRKRYPVKVKPSGKTGQLSCLVSGFLSKAASRKQWLFTQKLAAWTSLPLTEVEPDQSANLCFHCNHLQRLYLAHCTACTAKMREFSAKFLMTLTADCVSLLPTAYTVPG